MGNWPAAVIMAKLIVPETEKPKTLGKDVKPHYEREDNFIMAIISGANSGLRYLGGIVALLAATLACLMTGAVAGTFYRQSSILLGK